MSDPVTDGITSGDAKLKGDRARWRREESPTRCSRFRLLAASCCLFATLLGNLFGLTALGSIRPNTVLVSFYMLPPAEETLGVCAPFHPLTNHLFGLTPANIEPIPRLIPELIATLPEARKTKTPDSEATTSTESNTTAETDNPKSVSFRITDWQPAVENCGKSDELILHVSSMARIEHEQVVFFGRCTEQSSQITFKELLTRLGQSKAKKTLVVLEVYWPMLSDHGDSQPRIKQLDQSIRREFAQLAPRGCQLLLSNLGTDASVTTPNQPQSMLCKTLTLAMESPTCDCNYDGRTSIHEIVRWVSQAAMKHESNRNQLPELTLVGERCDFDIIPKSPEVDTLNRVYPMRLAASWQLWNQYLQATHIPLTSLTASRWGSRLNDLEYRWRRGEPNGSIDAETEQIEATCIGEISLTLKQRRSQRRDSLSIASYRFPLNPCQEANRNAIELLQSHADIMATMDASAQPAAMKKLVANYIAKFPPQDACLALSELLKTVEQTACLDAGAWGLICEVSEALPGLKQYPIVDAIGSMANHPYDSHRFNQQLRLFHLQDQLGTDRQAAAILSKSLSRVYEIIVTAQRLSTTAGMTQQEIVNKSISRAILSAESIITVENTISQAIRRLELIALTLSLDNASGLFCDPDTNYDALLASAERFLDILQRIQTLSDANQTPPASELAFLRQEFDSIDRLIRVDHSDHKSSYHPTRAQSYRPCDAIKSSTTQDRLKDICDRLTHLMSDVEQRTAQTWQSFIGSAMQVEAIASFQLIARQTGVSSNASTMPLRVIGDLRQLSWDNPDANFELVLDQATSGASPIRYHFLAPASSALRIVPDHGVLTAGEAKRIHVSLGKSHDSEGMRELQGVWLKAGGKTHEVMIPISMNSQVSKRCVEIDFGSNAILKGRQVCIPLWPSNDAQDLCWSLRSNDPAINLVVVSVIANGGETVVSQPIDLTSEQPTLISFPPPKPAEPNHSVPNPLVGPLTVIVSDSKDGKPLGNWQVTTQISDPRTMLQPGWAEFVIRDDGTNRFSVNIEKLTKVDTCPAVDFAPVVRLELESDALPSRSLIDIGNSRLQAVMKSGQSAITLYAENLRFVEGSPPVVMIPLSINGDRGYFEMEGRFPRRSGTVKFLWDQQPRLRIQAVDATSQCVPFQATIEARNLDDNAELLVEVVNTFGDAHDRVWQTKLATSRRIDCSFTAAGPNATLTVHAARRDWTVSIPSDYGTGEYRLRTSTVLPAGNVKPFAEHRFLIDDKVPTHIQARADVGANLTIVHIACQPSASGVGTLSLSPASAVLAEKMKPMIAQRVDPTGSRWQVKWPEAIPIPEQLELTFVTGAGKKHSTTCDLSIQRIASVGKLVGNVLEGSIAQPRLTVTLRNVGGIEIAKYTTDDHGHFEFSVPPGPYQVSVEKVATHRKAAMQVAVGQGEVRQVNLNLQRSAPGGA